MNDTKIDVHYLTRVEGHGNIVLRARDGKVEELKWEVIEAPRFFEAMLRGRYYNDVPTIASRICGICSIAHTIASVKAVEAAFGIIPSEQTLVLRRLLHNAEFLESHILHILFLAAPDFLGAPSVFPLVDSHRETVEIALRLKRLAYNLAEIIAGRKTHPLGCVPGGFAVTPKLNELAALRQRLENARADLDNIVELFKTVKVPDFSRQTEYISLKDSRTYATVSGDLASSDSQTLPVSSYLEVTNEFCVPWSTAKYTRHKRESYMVGALSRFNLNSRQLLPPAARAAEELGLRAPSFNPYMITLAQLVESIHVVEDSIGIIDHLSITGLKEEPPAVKIRAGRGIGAVEAPRGLLIHDYTFDEKGILTHANCVIPTNQNHNNIQKDMEKMAPDILNLSEDEIRLRLEMLVRAYDPCISCSTHALKISII
ncbi:MAG: Ni/Fe hydrogenase subunit alpha [Dehalococcoidales bacterium]|nr:Ni/Fe hydrogenase subunit alpha [Dehalococcoidales bacterium]